MEGVVFRSSTPEDMRFVRITWLQSFRRSKGMRDMPGPEYYARQAPVVDTLLRTATTIVAAEKNTDEILGYMVVELLPHASVVHWLHVKNIFRNLGIGGRLIGLLRPETPIHYTHKQSSVHGLQIAKKLGAIYNPKLLNIRPSA